MALVSGGRSTLNPNAPLFIPAAFRQVEDFSPEWWQLVTTSTWYRDYWLSQHPEGFFDHAEDEFNCDDVVDLLPDSIDFGDSDEFSSMEAQFEEFIQFTEAEGNKLSSLGMDGKAMNGTDAIKNMTALKTLDANGFWSKGQPAKYAEKPTKNMSPKYSPRCIQQPR
ncbi:protein EARLY RESPONSIVE TO DEHYDRATION 15 [Punica granatum]|uniref:Uncharacterized protein n=2 Tax=Punica granatum TaxID=22663 RepID=A0A218XKG8_PUNGR|nr:protein EARLY RESPONSIVE TO DEHYDRATION 15 [Punica granatum]OWM85447.1 hypothetical protein CDL15_Pgr019071 [Punica granatum]PKI42056.1 hypothetical protein CRG98_037509 [Punica granatum]